MKYYSRLMNLVLANCDRLSGISMRDVYRDVTVNEIFLLIRQTFREKTSLNKFRLAREKDILRARNLQTLSEE